MKVYVVTGKNAEVLKVTENKDDAFKYSEAVVSVHEFESHFESALKEIEALTRGMTQFHYTYEKIHKIASEALGVNENE